VPWLNALVPILIGSGVVVGLYQIIRAFRIGNIRTRLIIAFMALLLPVVGIALVSVVTSYQWGLRQITDHLESVALVKEAEINRWTNELQTALTLAMRRREVSEDGQVIEHDLVDFVNVLLQESPDSTDYQIVYNHLQSDLEQTVAQMQLFQRAFLIGPDGLVLVSTDAEQVGDDYGDQEYFRRGLDGFYIEPPSSSSVVAPRLLNVAHPVVDSQGQTVAVLVGSPSMDVLNDIVSGHAELGEVGQVYLVSKDYVRLTDARFTETDIRTVGALAVIENQANGSEFYRDASGVTVVGIYRWLPKLQVALLAEQEQTEALEFLYIMTGIIVGVSLAAIGLAIAAWLFIARGISNPLANLIDTAVQIAAGDLDRVADVEREDEIGAMARTFNDMTSRMKDLIRSLQERTEELESRTREIEASQRVTFAASARTDPDELLNLVVNLMRDQFHLYHAQVYIVDEEEQTAVLRQSTGYAGRQLLRRKHKIPLDSLALVTKAIRDGESVVVDDVARDPNFLPNPLLPDTRSELVVPLKTADRVIGVLDVQDRNPGRFTPNIVALFQTIVDQVAFLFENSDLLLRVTEQTETLTTFTEQLRTSAEIARRLGAILDPDHLLQQVVELIRSRFGLYHVHVYVMDITGVAEGVGEGQLVVRAGSGDVGRVLCERRHSVPLDHERSLVARAARARDTLLVEDTTLESDFVPNPLLPQTRSEMAVSLIAGDRVLGVLDLQDDQPGRFTQAERDTLTTLAGQIATALQTAALFEQAQARLRVSRALSGTQTEEQVLDAVVQAAGFYPDARFSLYTIDPEVEELTAVVRRNETFDSGIPSVLPVGTRVTPTQFKLLEHVSSGTTFVSSNFVLDRRVDQSSREVAHRQGVVSMALCPIPSVVHGDGLSGVLLASSREEGYFDERKMSFYQALAEQGSVALHTARLYDEIQRTAEQLRELDRLKSEFLANMSHELRTPLNSIIGYTEIMLMGLEGEMDPDTYEDVEAIHSNGRHLLRLINDVLDMAKIDAGRMMLNIEEHSIDSLFDDAREGVNKLLKTKPISMFVEVEEDVPMVEGDRLRLNQIIQNLLTNAITFTEKGFVTLRAYTDRSGREGSDWVCIEVEDSGIGIPEDKLEVIFDRFQQADGSSTRTFGGSGLGLSITRQLVHMHGGVIEVKSQPGEGSTFTVRLPVRRRELSAG
jgi:signal transduction histidine kinase/putative methionine-R-sulfoxide reductase with GAF domain